MTALTLAPSSRAETEKRTAFALSACSAVASDACVPALRHFVVHCVQRLGLPDDLRDAAELVASELITNSVLHSGSHSVAVLVSTEGRRLIISVRDRGAWRTRTDPRHSQDDDGVVCGRGLGLVRALADCLAVATGPTGTVVKAFLCIGPPAPVSSVS
ncbi:ATP-binding protein [Streptomyces sp. MSC1_001]|jgi:anti-sigma regulatory factor (Ser/Thr protein kinase)|uniref:ATP-binding protein n=1 Tax=Streptomyces sp. MSC1_001 TaxID=2909263 RepID=UPI002030A3AF|nr:ATP-binding protein [Streptomyces sp. MSC1_001]